MKRRRMTVSFFFIALLVFIAYEVVRILLPFFQPVFWACVLAFGFDPIHQRLRRLWPKHSSVAPAVVTLLIFTAIVPLAILVISHLATETVRAYQWCLASVEEGRLRNLLEQIQGIPLLQKVRYEDWLLNSARPVAHFAAKQAAMMTKSILLLPVNFLLTLFLVFFLLRDGRKVYSFIYEITPLEEENKKVVFRQLVETFQAVIRGQVFTALAQAAVAGVVFSALRLPFPLFFAALTFLTALVPVVGAAAIWAPLAIYLGVVGQLHKAAFLALAGVFGISLIDNLLRPILIGHKTKLPFPLLFLGILGGARVYGLTGVFLAPVLLSVFFVLVKIYRGKYLS